MAPSQVMGIVGRIGRNLEAAFSGLLDAAEDPAKSLDQTLRELREQLRLGRKELVKSVAAERRLRDSQQRLTAEEQKWGQRAELAVRHGDDELARRALVQKKRVAAERTGAEQSLNAQRGAALELRDTLEQMQARYRDFESRQGTLRAKLSQASPSASGFGAANAALEAFGDLAEQIDGVDDVVQAQREVDAMFETERASEASLELRFRQLEEQQVDAGEQFGGASEIDEELDALKQRMRVQL